MPARRREGSSAVSRSLDRLVHTPLRGLFGLRLALVVILFAPAESELYLAPAVFIEIDRKRDQSETLLRLESAVELEDLFFVHQKSAHSERVDIVPVALLIRRDVHACDDQLAFAGDLGIALLDTDAASADRLDLSTCENDARLIAFLDEVVVEGFLVISNYFPALLSQNIPPVLSVICCIRSAVPAMHDQNVRILLKGKSLIMTLPLIWLISTRPTSLLLESMLPTRLSPIT